MLLNRHSGFLRKAMTQLHIQINMHTHIYIEKNLYIRTLHDVISAMMILPRFIAHTNMQTVHTSG